MRIQSRSGLNCRAQIVSLNSPSAGVSLRETPPHGIKHRTVVANRLADNESPRFLQGPSDFFASRNFTQSRVAGAVLQNDDIAREERTMGTAQVQQHAVLAGDRNDQHFGNNG